MYGAIEVRKQKIARRYQSKRHKKNFIYSPYYNFSAFINVCVLTKKIIGGHLKTTKPSSIHHMSFIQSNVVIAIIVQQIAEAGSKSPQAKLVGFSTVFLRLGKNGAGQGNIARPCLTMIGQKLHIYGSNICTIGAFHGHSKPCQ